MPQRNRVTPFGEIVAVPQRGLVFGNRGVLHDDTGRVRRSWQGKRWLLCLLAFRGRRRPLADPGRYTALFFLDEATGLAAGHRPCFECRRERFLAFRDAWVVGTGWTSAGPPTAAAIDDQLHAERLGLGGAKRTFPAKPAELPDGVFVTGDVLAGRACLLWRGRLLVWSPDGYRERVPMDERQSVSVLTPPATVAAIRAGYVPEVHPSAQGF
jgi:hypothetical protein